MSNRPAGQRLVKVSVNYQPRQQSTYYHKLELPTNVTSVIKLSDRERVGNQMAEEMVDNKRVVLKCYIDRMPLDSDLEVKIGRKMKLEAPSGSGALVVKNLYLSCDPYMRGRMRDFHGSYVPPFVLGEVKLFMHSRCLCKCLAENDIVCVEIMNMNVSNCPTF